MDLRILDYRDVQGDLRHRLDELLREAFPDMHGDFYGPTEPWRLVVGAVGEVPVAHLAVYVRRVFIDGLESSIGLIGGIAVAREFRRRGVAKAMLSEAHDLLRGTGIGYSVLFAFAPRQYASSGYHPMHNETRFIESGQTKQFVYQGGMVAQLAETPWRAGLLDLAGPVV